jgi:hypothetical protein
MNFFFEENLPEHVSVGTDDTQLSTRTETQSGSDSNLNLANIASDFAEPLLDFIGVGEVDQSSLLPGDWAGLPGIEFSAGDLPGGKDSQALQVAPHDPHDTADNIQVGPLSLVTEPDEDYIPRYLDDSYIVGPGSQTNGGIAGGATPCAPGPRFMSGTSRYMSGMDVALTLAFVSGIVRLSEYRPKAKTSRRIKHVVAESDTLSSIAQEYFQDVTVAWLILEINVGRVRQYVDESCVVVELSAGQELDVPSALDLKEFYQSLDTYPLDSQLVTIVTAKDGDRECLEQVFADVLGLGPQSSLLQV